MAKRFQATCAECGRIRHVRRVELLRAAKPRCLKCGGRLELSKSAEEDLARINAAQSGARGTSKPGPRPSKEPEAQRIIPVRETQRYEFWEHPDLYRYMLLHLEKLNTSPASRTREMIRQMGPVAFYNDPMIHSGGTRDTFRAALVPSRTLSGRSYGLVGPGRSDRRGRW